MLLSSAIQLGLKSNFTSQTVHSDTAYRFYLLWVQNGTIIFLIPNLEALTFIVLNTNSNYIS